MAAPARLGPDFNRFWAAAAASNLGDGIRLGALPLLAISLTDDARLIALVTAATLVPWLLFGPFGGAIVDRNDRRRLMIAGQVGRSALVTALAVTIAVDAVAIWWVIVVAFGLGIGEVVVDSSSQAAIPQLVESHQLDRANGRLIATITVLDQVVGVTVGALLFAAAAELPFAIDAVTFVVGATLLLTVRRPLQGVRTTTTTVRQDIAEGMRYLFQHRLLRGLVAAISTTNFAGNMSFGVLVVLVVDELDASEAGFGIVLGVGAVGGVVGSVIAGRLTERLGRRTVLLTMPLVLAGSYLLNAAATAPWMVGLAFFVASFAVVCANVPGQSLRQSVVPERLLGRVVASFRMFGMGAAPIGALAGGVMAEAVDVRAANVGAAVVQAAAWFLFLAAFRHLDDALADAEEWTVGRERPDGESAARTGERG